MVAAAARPERPWPAFFAGPGANQNLSASCVEQDQHHVSRHSASNVLRRCATEILKQKADPRPVYHVRSSELVTTFTATAEK
jgi:hypothetical protein